MLTREAPGETAVRFIGINHLRLLQQLQQTHGLGQPAFGEGDLNGKSV